MQDEAQRMTLIVRTANEEPVAATSPEVTSAEQSWVSLPALRDLSGRIKELANNTVSYCLHSFRIVMLCVSIRVSIRR